MIGKIRNILSYRFTKDVGYLTIGSMVKTAGAFVASIFITRLLGVEQYGVYAIAMSLSSVILMFTRYSYDYSMTTVLSEQMGEDDRVEIRKSIIWFMKNITVSNFVLLGLIFLTPWIAARLYPSYDHLALYSQIYLLSVFFAGFLSLTRIVLQIVRRVKSLSVLNVSTDLAWRIVAICFLFLGLKIIGVVMAQLITSLLFVLVALYLYYRVSASYSKVFPTMREIFAEWRSVSLFRNAKFTFALTIDNNLASLNNSLPVFFLGILSTPAEAGYLNLALNMIAVPRLLAGNVSTMLSSVLPFKKGAADQGQWIRDFFKSVRISFATMFVLFVVFGLVAYMALPYIYGDAFSGAGVPFVLLTLMNLGIGFTLGIGPVLRTLKRVDLSILYNIVGAAAMVIVMLIAIPAYGAVGAALGMFVWKIFQWVLTAKMFGLLNQQTNDKIR